MDDTQAAFNDAALARDEAGYLGTPAQCIRDLAEENKQLRLALSTIRYEARNPPDTERMARIVSYVDKAFGF